MNPLKFIISDFIRKDLFRVSAINPTISNGHSGSNNIISSLLVYPNDLSDGESLYKESSLYPDELSILEEEAPIFTEEDIDLIKSAQLTFPGEAPLFPDIYLKGRVNPSQIFSAAAEDFRRRFGGYPNVLLAMFRQHWNFIAPLMRYYVTYQELEMMIRYGVGYGTAGFGPQRGIMLRALREAFGPTYRTINRVFADVHEKAKRIIAFDTAIRNNGLIGAMRIMSQKGISPYDAYISWRQYRDNLINLALNPEQAEGKPVIVPFAFGEFSTQYSDLLRSYRTVKTYLHLARTYPKLATEQRFSNMVNALDFILKNDASFVPSVFFNGNEYLMLKDMIKRRLTMSELSAEERDRLSIVLGAMDRKDAEFAGVVSRRLGYVIEKIDMLFDRLSSSKIDRSAAEAVMGLYEDVKKGLKDLADLDSSLLTRIFKTQDGQDDVQRMTKYVSIMSYADSVGLDMRDIAHVRNVLDSYIVGRKDQVGVITSQPVGSGSLTTEIRSILQERQRQQQAQQQQQQQQPPQPRPAQPQAAAQPQQPMRPEQQIAVQVPSQERATQQIQLGEQLYAPVAGLSDKNIFDVAQSASTFKPPEPMTSEVLAAPKTEGFPRG